MLRACTTAGENQDTDTDESRDGSEAGEIFAERLNRLFAVVRPVGRGPYSNTEVVGLLQARGYRLSKAYLSQLRNGRRVRPRRSTVEGLAEFFGVPPGYLYGHQAAYTRYIDRELWWTAQLHDPQVRQLTGMILDLSPAAQRELLAYIDRPRTPVPARRRPARAGVARTV